MTPDLDDLIKKYSEKLMELLPFAQDSQKDLQTQNETSVPPQQSTDSLTDETAADMTDSDSEALPLENNSPTDNSNNDDLNFADDDEDTSTEPTDSPSQSEKRPIPTNPQNFATFRARVFSGNSAFAVENAKVSVHIGDELYAFLVTDKNGETITVKLESFPEENSLEPLSEDQSLEYAADVSADGFITQKNLLVSAVGGSDIVLNVQLVPESEGVN